MSDNLTAMPARAAAETGDIVLEVKNLNTVFPLRKRMLEAVKNVSFTLHRGRTTCVVGESGSGKSVTARSILKIVDPPGQIVGGEVILHRHNTDRGAAGGEDLIDLARLDPRGKPIRAIRGRDIAMIFQEPMSSLSPVHTIGDQVAESIRLHEKASKKDVARRVIELLTMVEIPRPEEAAKKYPFEYSGGMRQRVMIAMALACNPSVLIADEPTTALDVTTQAEILDLIANLQRNHGMAVMFITHDMGVVAEIAHDVVVMYLGEVVEKGTVEAIFNNPQEAYTKRLLDSVTRLGRRAPQKGEQPRDLDRRAEILRVENLNLTFGEDAGLFGGKTKAVKAVDDVSLVLHEGEALGIVGESGSGKTTLGRCIARIYDPNSGKVIYHTKEGSEVDLASLPAGDLKQYRREIRMIFQDPFASLNPRMTISQIIAEPLIVNGVASGSELQDRVADLLTRVGLPTEAMERYPHAFSGGQRQRVGIARAIAVDPRIVIADEATSALDVSVRTQVLDLLIELQKELGLSFLFISHDIAVIRYFCDRVGVMYRGKLVETGDADAVCDNPTHPYTKALLSAVPGDDPSRRRIAQRTRYAPAAE
ncbi:ABC transporter ATP-binding protein [Acuticoccus sp. MNP-M23]|uniref:ABC transporter ATP-binding protein n=1 Tax=Acuticoccus sp. MNP-M23 TaxID=3072793 RepID=UPI002815352B|nr:ABC transporter ATP-binding protein [Acuticoccus sp. MNP-M23]WMS44019.1 ABC transporter ATP-binding protein [Acuticoccus sp. MNP-M23]